MARKPAAKKNEVSDEMLQKIRSDIAEWEPGLWAERVAYGPACKCGVSDNYLATNATYTTYGKPIRECPQHPGGHP